MPRVSKDAERERRSKLVAVGQKAFLSKGFDKTTVKDITDKLNLATGTFYYHFKSKEELLVEVSENLLRDEMIQMQELCDAGQLPPSLRMKAALNLVFQTFYSNKSIWGHVCNDITLHRQLFMSLLMRISPFLARLLDQGNKKGEFHIPHPSESAEIILSLIDFYIWQYGLTTNKERRLRLLNTAEEAIGRILGVSCKQIFSTQWPGLDKLEKKGTFS